MNPETVQGLADAALPAVERTQEMLKIWDLALKGGWIMIPLVLLLLLTVYIFIERCVLLHRAGKEQANFMMSIRDFVYNNKVESAVALCQRTDGPVARLIE